MAMVWVIDPHYVVMVFRTFAPLKSDHHLCRAVAGSVADAREDSPRSDLPYPAPLRSGSWSGPRPLISRMRSSSSSPSTTRYDSALRCRHGTRRWPADIEETLMGPRFFRLFEVPEDAAPSHATHIDADADQHVLHRGTLWRLSELKRRHHHADKCRSRRAGQPAAGLSDLSTRAPTDGSVDRAPGLHSGDAPSQHLRHEGVTM